MPSALLRRPEDRLILQLLRLDGQADPPEFPDFGPIDWEWVYRRSLDSVVLALIYERLRSWDGVPPETLERMRRFSVDLAMHWVTLQHSAETIVGALAAADVPVIVLKGAALAATVYEFPTLRLVGDLDLLVDEERLDRAMEVLADLNFQQQSSSLPPEHHHLPVFFDSLGNRAELHRHIVRGRFAERIPPSLLFARSRPFQLGKTEARMLSPEHLVVHACLHASLGHKFEGMLYQLCDIARIERRLDVDWDLLHQEVSGWGAERPVYWCLAAARDMVGAQAPAQILKSLRPASIPVERFMQRVIPELLLGGRSWPPRKTYLAAKTCEQLLLTPSFTRAALVVSKSVVQRKIAAISQRTSTSQ